MSIKSVGNAPFNPIRIVTADSGKAGRSPSIDGLIDAVKTDSQLVKTLGPILAKQRAFYNKIMELHSGGQTSVIPNEGLKFQLDPTNGRNRAVVGFLEAEAKAGFANPAMVEAFRKALRASPEKGMQDLLPGNKQFGHFTLRPDRPEAKTSTEFLDFYWDDNRGTLYRGGDSTREREIFENGVSKGKSKYETKLVGDYIKMANGEPSLIFARHENYASCISKTPDEWLSEAVQAFDNGTVQQNFHNPVVLLKLSNSDLDLTSLRRRTQQKAQREQYLISDPSITDPKKQDLFLITLDSVEGTILDTNETGKFHEIEVENLSGSTTQEEQDRLIAFTEALRAQWGLVHSKGTKYQQAIDAAKKASKGGAA